MRRVLYSGCILFVTIVSISSAVNETIFKNTLFEVGEMCVNTVVNANIMDILPDFLDFFSPFTYILLVGCSIAGYYLYGLLFRPMNRIRILGETGYLPDGKFSKKDIANSVKRRRVVGDIPPVYPNGWFGIIESWKLKKDPVNVSVLGKTVSL